jgi:hypothetical protein
MDKISYYIKYIGILVMILVIGEDDMNNADDEK